MHVLCPPLFCFCRIEHDPLVAMAYFNTCRGSISNWSLDGDSGSGNNGTSPSGPTIIRSEGHSYTDLSLLLATIKNEIESSKKQSQSVRTLHFVDIDCSHFLAHTPEEEALQHTSKEPEAPEEPLTKRRRVSPAQSTDFYPSPAAALEGSNVSLDRFFNLLEDFLRPVSDDSSGVCPSHPAPHGNPRGGMCQDDALVMVINQAILKPLKILSAMKIRRKWEQAKRQPSLPRVQADRGVAAATSMNFQQYASSVYMSTGNASQPTMPTTTTNQSSASGKMTSFASNGTTSVGGMSSDPQQQHAMQQAMSSSWVSSRDENELIEESFRSAQGCVFFSTL